MSHLFGPDGEPIQRARPTAKMQAQYTLRTPDGSGFFAFGHIMTGASDGSFALACGHGGAALLNHETCVELAMQLLMASEDDQWDEVIQKLMDAVQPPPEDVDLGGEA